MSRIMALATHFLLASDFGSKGLPFLDSISSGIPRSQVYTKDMWYERCLVRGGHLVMGQVCVSG